MDVSAILDGTKTNPPKRIRTVCGSLCMSGPTSMGHETTARQRMWRVEKHAMASQTRTFQFITFKRRRYSKQLVKYQLGLSLAYRRVLGSWTRNDPPIGSHDRLRRASQQPLAFWLLKPHGRST